MYNMLNIFLEPITKNKFSIEFNASRNFQVGTGVTVLDLVTYSHTNQ